ncbi:MAG: linear amide C-N hydrolase [Bacteroidales bacterium]
MKKIQFILSLVAVGAGLLCFFPSAKACTRALYVGEQNLVITGRTMDWKEDMRTNLYVFPRGIERKAGLTENSMKWTSKYGSVIAAGYDIGTADGMNEKGLVANLLFLVESDYSRPNDTRPIMGISYWAQYVLDNFATVEEAVQTLQKDLFRLNAPKLPNGVETKLHLSISDALGNSAIVEYEKGNVVIYEGPQYQVMTNSPFYNQQLAINNYWKQVGGLQMLPGTNRAADRFARASFYIDVIPKTANERIGVAGVFSVMRNVSVPLGISTEDQPNISTTIWRTVSDQKNLKYYYESTLSPNVFWIDLLNVDFSPGASVKKLPLDKGEIYAGDVSSHLIPGPGFTFEIDE